MDNLNHKYYRAQIAQEIQLLRNQMPDRQSLRLRIVFNNERYRQRRGIEESVAVMFHSPRELSTFEDGSRGYTFSSSNIKFNPTILSINNEWNYAIRNIKIELQRPLQAGTLEVKRRNKWVQLSVRMSKNLLYSNSFFKYYALKQKRVRYVIDPQSTRSEDIIVLAFHDSTPHAKKEFSYVHLNTNLQYCTYSYTCTCTFSTHIFHLLLTC